MNHAPHGYVIHISPYIGEILHTGEIFPRIPSMEEAGLLNIQPIILSKNFPNYREALLGLSEELKRIANEEKNGNDIRS